MYIYISHHTQTDTSDLLTPSTSLSHRPTAWITNELPHNAGHFTTMEGRRDNISAIYCIIQGRLLNSLWYIRETTHQVASFYSHALRSTEGSDTTTSKYGNNIHKYRHFHDDWKVRTFITSPTKIYMEYSRSSIVLWYVWFGVPLQWWCFISNRHISTLAYINRHTFLSHNTTCYTLTYQHSCYTNISVHIVCQGMYVQ